MQINGSGGSFAVRRYDIEKNLAWQLGLLAAKDMEVIVTKEFPSEYVLEGKLLSDEKTMLFGNPMYKLFTFSVADNESGEGVEVIVDIRKEKLEVYSFKPQDTETNAFFAIFDQKVKVASRYKSCPECGKMIGSEDKFCPECGHRF